MMSTTRKRPRDATDEERQRLEDARRHASVDLSCPGAGHFRIEDNDHTQSIKELLQGIVHHFGQLGGVTWGEGSHDEDPRRRMYGFLPGQQQKLLDMGIKIQKEGAPNDEEHDWTVQNACVNLAFASGKGQNGDKKNDASIAQDQETNALVLDSKIWDALHSITKRVHDLVPTAYKRFATMEELVAAQPNLHNGASYLPAHLDYPRNDGFGVIIVTISIHGNGDIVLIDDGDEGVNQAVSYSFTVRENECYFLCGDARNKCVHGVLCSTDNQECQRQTLNLRYGLHSAEFADSEVNQHWNE